MWDLFKVTQLAYGSVRQLPEPLQTLYFAAQATVPGMELRQNCPILRQFTF